MSTTHLDIQVSFHSTQHDFFFQDRDVRFKTLHKGRRWGFTRGAMQYAILAMLGAVPKPGTTDVPYSRILWGDTINSNIDRYMERYGFPVLKQLPSKRWDWKKVRRELHILSTRGTWSIMDMRSADKPENWEGFGYDLVILNEAGIILKDSYLWENAVSPMIMDYQSPMIVGGTPKGKKDKKRKKLNGKELAIFYELAHKGMPKLKDGTPNPIYNPRYKTYVYTSYDNNKLHKEEIDNLAADLPSVVRDQEIFGLFVDEITGDVFLREWWQYYDAASMPTAGEFVRVIVSWDTAFKDKEENDFSVATVWGVTKNGIYLLDMWRDRVKFPDLKKNAILLSEAWKADWTIIEDKASGSSLADELEEGTRLNLQRVPVDKDKITRAVVNTPDIEAGRVFIPSPRWRPWVSEFIEEHAEFPNGEYDDIVDSASQALTFIKSGVIPSSGSGTTARRV